MIVCLHLRFYVILMALINVRNLASLSCAYEWGVCMASIPDNRVINLPHDRFGCLEEE